MSNQIVHTQIVLINYRYPRLERSAQTLHQTSFNAESLAHSGYPYTKQLDNISLRLVVAKCANIGAHEMELSQRILDYGSHLLVHVTSISSHTMRSLIPHAPPTLPANPMM